EPAAGKGGREDLRQSAKFRGGIAAAARFRDHRQAAAAFLCLSLGRSLPTARRHPLGSVAGDEILGFPAQPAHAPLRYGAGGLVLLRGGAATARYARIRHRW